MAYSRNSSEAEVRGPCQYILCASCHTSKVIHLQQGSSTQGRIKGFVGPRHFSSLGCFGDSRSIFGTTVYSRLSGLMEGEGCTDNLNFIFYTPTVPLAGQTEKCALVTHFHFTGRLGVEFF
jgi:hypothetical protein